VLLIAVKIMFGEPIFGCFGDCLVIMSGPLEDLLLLLLLVDILQSY
jgi:hypothetical protein